MRSNKTYPTARKHLHTAAMTVAARNIAIEKNRAALLRIVQCWLIIAAMIGIGRNCMLPQRIGHFVSDMIFKVEKAVQYLQIASGHMQAGEPVQQYGPITIKVAINRLKAVKRALIRLKPGSGGVAERDFCFKPPQANNCPRNAYIRGGLRVLAIFNSRAPPFP